MSYFVRPVKRDEDYDSDDERRRRKRGRREQNLGLSLNGQSTGSPPDTLPDLAKYVSKLFPRMAPSSPPTAPGVKRVLQSFQKEGVAWMNRALTCGVGVVLADEMGLGKTTQAIAAFLSACPLPPADVGKSRPKLLVAAPLSVVPSWLEEFSAVVDLPATGLIVRRYGGSREERESFVCSVEASIAKLPMDGSPAAGPQREFHQFFVDVIITTPEYLLTDSWFLAHLHFDMIIFDEAHRLKNAQSKLYERLLQQYLPHIPRKLLLTGTPLSNSPIELWNLIRLANPVLCSGCTALNGIDASSGEEFSRAAVEKLLTEDEGHVQALKQLSETLLLRRLKVDVLQGLPPMTEVVLRIPLSPLQLSLYSGILKNDVALLGSIFSSSSSSSGGGGKLSLLNTLMQLRKCCNHPYMFTGVEPEPFVIGEHLVLHSGKMVVLDKLLATLQREGHRALLFSQYTYTLDIIQDYLEYRNWSFVRLDGSVRGEDRESAVQTFQRSLTSKKENNSSAAESPFVFLLSTRAGGVGLTLTAADTVIFFDSDWNPQMDLQAQQRAHRIGQTKPVTVYRLCASNTVEEGILAVAAKKRKLASDFIEHASSSDDGAKLSASELKDMVRLAVARLPKCSGDAAGGSAELQWSKFASNLSIPDLLAVASASIATDLVSSLKDDADQEAFNVALESLRTEAAASRKALHRRSGEDDEEDTHGAGDRSSDSSLYERKRTTESERLVKMQKSWGKASYFTSALPLTADVYRAVAIPSVTTTATDECNAAKLSIIEQSMLHHVRLACGDAETESLTKTIAANSCLIDKIAIGESGEAAPEEGMDDAVAAEEHGAPVEHIRGDLFTPVTDSKNPPPLRLIIIPVNNGGTWGTGRLFSTALSKAPSVSAQYSSAKDNSDLRLGDAHVMFTPGAPFGVQIVLAVIQRSSTAGHSSGGEVDMKALDMVMRRVETYSQICCKEWKVASSTTLHFPLFNALSKEAAYALDKILAKHTGGGWKRCYMYHAAKRGCPIGAVDRSPRVAAAAIPPVASPGTGDRPIAKKRDRHDSPGSWPEILAQRLPAPGWSLAEAAKTSIFIFASPSVSASSTERIALTKSILALGGVFATLAEAYQYLLEGESPNTFVIITNATSDDTALSPELSHFVLQYPTVLVVEESWLISYS
ncbi:chromodomain helicase dna binding protein 1, putative [Bodo saltans]|uniref:Chromodomain helicase dna binding protein 1, putative n=1 Tax=Bodo saltans TaxID=75058 RepID=A0A0S4JIZ6_BODSA|nr:chromodomain helicase dna binding protein 1, putative [Bodo saltans]|eukprot:CUG91492.1 chromodomain helicase dna binding protein 1, putative [Bodo saltans]